MTIFKLVGKNLSFGVLVFMSCLVVASPHKVKVAGPQSTEDVSQSYFYGLLNAALQHTTEQYKIDVINATAVTQGRYLHLLAEGQIDVYWMGTSIERENDFYAVKIPLIKGLLGYRVSIIADDRQDEFEAASPAELKKMLACQGEHWPDTKILAANGFNVAPVANYKQMFDMVSRGRCDYFPRSIFEGFGELQQAKTRLANLTMFDDIIIYYPFPIYFFVRMEDQKLGEVIEKGLEAMIDNGDFDTFIKDHKVTKHLFPLSKWQNRKFLSLENPYLDKDTDYRNARYWISLPQKAHDSN